jgi:hypothetical protein
MSKPQPNVPKRHQIVEQKSDGTFFVRNPTWAETRLFNPLARVWHSAGSSEPLGRPKR